MQKIEMIISGTHLDRHGEKMSLNALNQMAEIINSKYIPITEGHNIRKPPIGRIAKAKVIQLPDSEYHLVGEGELFDKDDDLSAYFGDGRKISFDIDAKEIQKFELSIERDHKNIPETLDLLENIKSITNENAKYYAKKSETVDLVQLIITAGIFIVGAIATGFFSKLGEDAYNKLKKLLKDYFSTKREFNEKLQFTFYINKEDGICEITTLIIDSNSNTVEKLFETYFSGLDSLITSIPIDQKRIAKIYLEYENNKFNIKYLVRDDCVPLVLAIESDLK